jgi:hypothetical protein
LNDIPDLKGIYATKTGYQRGAQTKADKHKIELLVIRETNDSDWIDEDGTPYLKTLSLKIVAITPPQINSFEFGIDGGWFNVQDKYKKSDLKKLFHMPLNKDVLIIDEKNSERYSLLELGALLEKKVVGITYGKGEYEESYDNAYIEIKERDVLIKIKKLKVSYEYRKPMEMESLIDFSQQILGIVENYHTGAKKTVFHDGNIVDR